MTILTFEQVAAVALAGGWPAGPAVIATAITTCESSRNPAAVQQGEPYATTGWGLWQITPGDSVPQFGTDNAMLDPLNNAKAGHYKWQQAGGFSPWTTYGNGCYEQYLDQAETAVGKVAHLTRKQLDKLVGDIRPVAAGAAGHQLTGQNWAVQVRTSAGHVASYTLALADSAQRLHKARSKLVTPKVVIADPAKVLIEPRRIRGR